MVNGDVMGTSASAVTLPRAGGKWCRPGC